MCQNGRLGSASKFQVVKGFQVRQYDGGPLIRMLKKHGM